MKSTGNKVGSTLDKRSAPNAEIKLTIDDRRQPVAKKKEKKNIYLKNTEHWGLNETNFHILDVTPTTWRFIFDTVLPHIKNACEQIWSLQIKVEKLKG